MEYPEQIECPECGDLTYSLREATSLSTGQKTLMCEACCEEEGGFSEYKWDEEL